MANISKLTDKILEKIKNMAKDGYNHSEIAKELDFKRQTVSFWIKKFNIKTNSISGRENFVKKQQFIKICKDAISKNEYIKLNKILKEISLHPDAAQGILKTMPDLRQCIRSKTNAILEDKTLSIEEASSRLSDKNDQIIGFKNGKYEIRTLDGYIYKKTSAKISQGDPRGKSGKTLPIEYIKKKLLENQYTLIEESYTIKRKALKAIHNKCNSIRENRFSNFFDQECPVCSNTGTSKAEFFIDEWVKSLGLHTEKFRFKGKTKGKEIDIYIPSLNLGIEYCGLYWHNELSPQPRLRAYHYDKMIQANEQGIRLITIFEDEWESRNSQVKGFLKSILKKSKRRVFARKCEVKEVESKEARTFLEKYHIQGKTNFKVALGLFFEDELLGLVTGNTHHRQKGDNPPLVLNRLVFKEDCQIIGGSSKLLKSLMKYGKNSGYEKLISWSDNRWSQGNVYEKIGFILTESLGPDYSYVVEGARERQSKQSNKKKLLIKKGAVGTMNNTERELALSLNLYRIWDCGKKRWEIDL